MKYNRFYFLIFFSLVLAFRCSELQDQIPQAPNIAIHGEGVNNPSSSNFHGKYFTGTDAQGFNNCVQCHGSDLSGGNTQVSCVQCHSSVGVHKEGILNPSSTNFHGKYLANNLSWDMRQCGTCHGSDYSGGLASPTCLSCHIYENGPEQCNTCHGIFADPNIIAPPTDLNGRIETNYPGVGAHTAHLYENNLGNNLQCSTCHKFPSSMYASDHLGSDNKAEIIFGRLSVQGGANPTYNFTNNNCSATYCHGNFTFYRDSSQYAFAYTASTMKGNNVSVKWNQVDGSQAQCGSCHGLPPTGHVAATINTCVNCHPGVVDNQGNIVDRIKHINGIKNVFGN